MKIAFFILFLMCFGTFVSAQSWRNSLQDARKMYQEKAYSEALQKYQEAQKLAPKDIDLSTEIAQAAYRSGDLQRAEKAYQKSAKNSSEKKQKAINQYNLGNSFYKQEKLDQAIEAYKNALRNNPNDESARRNLVKAMTKKEKKDQQKKQQPPQNKDDQNDQPNQKPPANSEKENQQNSNKNPKQAPKQPNDGAREEELDSKLSDLKTNRILDELTKQEIETKKKMREQSSKSYPKKRGKDW
jgi:tetratricopeptide (TPR) repeat protein